MPRIPGYLRIEDPIAVLAVLLTVLAGLFSLASRPIGKRIFRILPLLLFAYFVPTVLSNTGVIPTECQLYDFIQSKLLPASLILLTMSVNIPAILRLGPKILILFFGGTLSIVLGGPLAYLALGWLAPPELGDQAWKGLAALSGSWIGGGANFIAVGKSVETAASMYSLMVVIDVALASVWMAVLLLFAGREEQMDAAIGADRRTLEDVKQTVASFQKEVVRPTSLADLLTIIFLAIAGTAIASYLASYYAPIIGYHFPYVAEILSEFAWTVLLVTLFGVIASFTPLRDLEGAGASHIGSLFLYVLVASIGAKAKFAEVLKAPELLLIAAVWIAFHAIVMLTLRHFLKAPVFFLAVGSQANIGGAASAPIVAGAFHPALAPVGALMGVVGYVVGTIAGLACAFLLRLVHQMS